MIKLPELILNKPYELDETLVLNRIRNYDFRNHHVYGDDSFEVCRIGGYRYIGRPDGSCRMIGWQCNFADVQNYDICLPTILYVETNADNQITCLRLNENFKGSQGIPCSYKYLNRRLQDFIGLPFSQKESRISDDLGTGCRHTFEVLFGACAFREWCLQHHVKDGWLSESTASMHTKQGIIAVDRNAVNGSETATEIRISNFKETLKYDHNGAICACTDMKIEGFTRGQEGERSAIGGEKTITAPEKNDFDLKLLKVLTKYWMRSGKNIGIKNKFYFSHLWPTTLFGILVQMFAIVIFSDSYSYFQHCIRGLQKDEMHCACIGVCEDIDECMKYFPDFDVENLF